jgi:hypothetical protein
VEVFMMTNLRVVPAFGSALILAACATTATHVAPKAGASEATAQSPACLSQTGSRIPGATCAEIGRSYSRDDISLTGSTTAAEALPLLDPSITVHR